MSDRPAEQKPDAGTPFVQLDRYVHEWLADAEVIGEDESGMEGIVSLTERDEWMREDAITGLISDEKFLDLVIAARQFQMEARRAEGRCPICGGPLGTHWGQRCESVQS